MFQAHLPGEASRRSRSREMMGSCQAWQYSLSLTFCLGLLGYSIATHGNVSAKETDRCISLPLIGCSRLTGFFLGYVSKVWV